MFYCIHVGCDFTYAISYEQFVLSRFTLNILCLHFPGNPRSAAGNPLQHNDDAAVFVSHDEPSVERSYEHASTNGQSQRSDHDASKPHEPRRPAPEHGRCLVVSCHMIRSYSYMYICKPPTRVQLL